MILTKEQNDIKEWVINGKGNAVINAVAGSGKTFTLLEVIAPELDDGLFCAFNNHIAKEIKDKNKNPKMKVMTVYGMGMAAIMKENPNTKVEKNKYKKVFTDCYQLAVKWGSVGKDVIENFDTEYAQMNFPYFPDHEILNLIDLSRFHLLDFRNSNKETIKKEIKNLVYQYGLDAEEMMIDLLTLVIPYVLNWGLENADSQIDFADMIWLPSVEKKYTKNLRKYDWILVDEVQDLSKAQREIVLKSLTKKARVIAVGDPNQAIYSFAGADHDSFKRIKEELKAVEFPLTTCFRCPVEHITLANSIVKEIKPAEKAIKGIVEKIDYDDIVNYANQGDIIICRLTNPLVKLCYHLISNGLKANIKGRDIGIGIVTFLKNTKIKNIENFLQNLSKYTDKEVKKALVAQNEDLALSIEDKSSCIQLIYNNSKNKINSIQDLQREIESIFSDKTESIVLSTVHRAKGLEAENIYILDEHLMPFTFKAKTNEDIRQEFNLRYVALTRSKNTLRFLYSDAAMHDKSDF